MCDLVWHRQGRRSVGIIGLSVIITSWHSWCGILLNACLLFYVLATSTIISGQELTCQCALLVTLLYCPTGTPGYQHNHDLILHSVTLSWHWANQPLPCSDNAESLARKRHVYNFKVISLTQPRFEPARFGFPNFPKSKTDSLLIRPYCQVIFHCSNLI